MRRRINHNKDLQNYIINNIKESIVNDKDINALLDNNVINEIQSHSNKMDMVKKEYNDIKYKLSRLVSDTFRAMYEVYGFVDEEINEEPYELKRRNNNDGR